MHVYMIYKTVVILFAVLNMRTGNLFSSGCCLG